MTGGHVGFELATLILILGSFYALQACETWTSVNETLYNRAFTSIDDPMANEKRPLGFKVVTLQFGQTVCFTVSPTDGNMRHIEIKWELEQEGTLCVRQKGATSGECASSTATNSICKTVPGGASSLQYEFYCEGTGCEGGAKLFWYRFVVESPLSDGMYDENWCSTRSSQYPSSLAVLPSNLPPPTTTTTGDAARLTQVLTSLVITFLTSIMLAAS